MPQGSCAGSTGRGEPTSTRFVLSDVSEGRGAQRPETPASSGHNVGMTSLVRTIPGSAPLVLDSPHSGVNYPEDFRSRLALQVLRRAEDTHVEKLYDFAPA